MNSARPDQIAIVGRSCRFPGAPNVEALWELVTSGRCAVAQIPEDRWPKGKFGHPRGKERGRSYTWAAGALEDIWGFDPAVFRISPREAEQIDPQQRLMLELVFEAFEDAGRAPSDFAGSRTGVYVGASALDYSIIGLHDMALADAYYATGNALSIVSNRISYIFDLHGPSLTIDTACSSSLVALHNACQALRHGEADAAIVGGVNILASPFGFISFSQATMLSPTGLCRAFSAEADGYVRSEGGVVLVLKTLERALADGDRIHAVVAGAGVNSDGRTSGIALPAEAYQTQLLESVYAQAGVSPDNVVYVEAHGTGTQAGDPVEAKALGNVLGRRRGDPLPIGSIKTNIGHTEPASGLAGLMKGMLALENSQAPRSLHFATPNPNIDFAGLNLEVVESAKSFRKAGERFVGVSSFGFGGTNAHIILTDPPKSRSLAESRPRYFMLSAQSEAALRTLAGDYAERLGDVGSVQARRIVAATNHRRERLAERLVLPADRAQDLAAALETFSQGADLPDAGVRGAAVDGDGAPVFVFSGNGSQWPGMGRSAYATNATFRDALDEVDAHFRPLAGWSLPKLLMSAGLAQTLAKTHIAQPLVFAIQVASVRALAAFGVRPALTLGHSVGEVAAAEAAGALSLADAVKVIFHRSHCQEITENAGGMIVVFGPRDAALALVAEFPSLTVATYNSHQCLVAAGPFASLDALATRAARAKLRTRKLDLAYPFHTSLMEPVFEPLMQRLGDLRPVEGHTPFLSTIAGGILAGEKLDAGYWWRNVRDPVHFDEGVVTAAALGKRVFVEIGPRATLRGHIRDTIEHVGGSGFVDLVLDEKLQNSTEDPFERSAMRLLAAGADIDPAFAFGADPGAGVALPRYPWRRTAYRYAETTESTGAFNPPVRHPLMGARDNADSLEWRATLDPELEPDLADHVVDGQVLLAGAAFIEMAIAVARDWKGADAVSLVGFEILQPMIFAPNASREVLCRVSSSTSTIEIMSRPRLSRTAFALHARGVVLQKAGSLPDDALPPEARTGEDAAGIYARARRGGLQFGPAYRRLAHCVRTATDTIEVSLSALPEDARYGLDPARLDSCFHGLILLFEDLDPNPGAYLPVRFEDIRTRRTGAPLAGARIRIRRADARVIVADFELFDDNGVVAAKLSSARYQSMRARGGLGLAQTAVVRTWVNATSDISGVEQVFGATEAVGERAPTDLRSDTILLEGWANSVVLKLVSDLSSDGEVDLDELVASGRLPLHRRAWLKTALDALEASALVTRKGGAYRRTPDRMPAPEAVLATLAAQAPSRAPELMIAARIGAVLRDFGAGLAELSGVSDLARDAFELRSDVAFALAHALGVRLDAFGARFPAEGALRILQIGWGPAISPVLRFAKSRGGCVTLLDLDPRRLERARLSLTQAGEVNFVGDLAALSDRRFDLVVSAGGLSRFAGRRESLKALAEHMSADGALIALESAPSLFQDLALGLAEDWFEDGVGWLRGEESWKSALKSAGFGRADGHAVSTQADPAIAIEAGSPAARKSKPAGAHAAPLEALVVCADETSKAFALTLKYAFASHNYVCRLVELRDFAHEALGKTTRLIYLPSALGDDPVENVARICLELRGLSLELGGQKLKLYCPLPAASPDISDAIASFLRTLTNECANLDVCRIEIPAWSAEVAERMVPLVVSQSAETDLSLRPGGVQVLRYVAPELSVGEISEAAKSALRLEKAPEGGLDRLNWRPTARTEPGDNEIEVEVVATGVNFRDVMWALSILPDEMLEDGFAGPTLGLEFSGRVVRKGGNVATLAVGEKVLGFCGGAFSSHVTVDAAHVARVPENMSCEAAATIPVAMLTAYYGLILCANLQRDEWVLVHGGAGGVGLSALQLAQWRGARTIVTAGSQEKRDLALALGADHAFDSRSTDFVDEVRKVTGGRGVAVVLNSLAGEAMERSLSLLSPFGRFVELGKRDYLTNTQLGLRPFRKNLSYFGVDLDQLLSARPEISRRLFTDVLALFESGDLTPLPYSVFDGENVVEALRLMQQSAHVGKIVVRPPALRPTANSDKRSFVVDAEGFHVITGGFGGFGLAAAEWLAKRGARRIVLAGRSGAASKDAKAALERLADVGVEVRAEAIDIADREAVLALFARLGEEAHPVAGVIHAAMVLDDAILANIDEARLAKVLRPKVAGAENLDAALRSVDVGYFVLFSSATTFIGNPGQGAYVAANGYLEGLARRRREAGLPALAIAWGAIADVGVLAGAAATRETLAVRSGVKGIDAERALDLMAEALAYPGGPGGDGVVAIADMNWNIAKAHLHLLKSPTYASLMGGEESADAAQRDSISLKDLSARLAPEQARKAVSEIVIEELARILRLPRHEVSKSKALSEIGLDSLMAVELLLSLETRFGLDTPLGASAGGFNVMELSGHLLATQVENLEGFSVADNLASKHLDENDKAEAAEFFEALQGRGVDIGAGSSPHVSATH